MNADEARSREFEERAGALLAESVARIDARVRSRLNQARHAALEEAARRRSFWRGPLLVPATGAVAAAALLVLVLAAHLQGQRGVALDGLASFEDVEMLTDADGLDLVENWDNGFYEWAVAQSADADGTSG